MVAGRAKGGKRKAGGDPDWVALDDERLMELRLCDLGLELAGSAVEAPIARVRSELEARGLRFRPHFWLSSEWFSPDGVPGVAIPFFLAHPRLIELERAQMLEVEGGTEGWCLKLLRHELGHAVDTAYRLHFKKAWREHFGRFTAPYEATYHPQPYSRSFVLHLDNWYAQSHPAEDFAETFAVWLTPGLDWRERYAGWPALAKLEYVEATMAGLAGKPAAVRCREQTERLSTLTRTLGEHYAAKRRRYRRSLPEVFDRDLRRLFAERSGPGDRRTAAATLMRRLRPGLRRRVARWTGQYQYTIEQVLEHMIQRLAALDLVVDRPVDETREDGLVLLTVHTMNYLHNGYHRLAR